MSGSDWLSCANTRPKETWESSFGTPTRKAETTDPASDAEIASVERPEDDDATRGVELRLDRPRPGLSRLDATIPDSVPSGLPVDDVD